MTVSVSIQLSSSLSPAYSANMPRVVVVVVERRRSYGAIPSSSMVIGQVCGFENGRLNEKWASASFQKAVRVF